MMLSQVPRSGEPGWRSPVAVFLGSTFASIGICAAQTAGDVPQLKQIFGPAAEKADYVMVIDTSGSMGAFWDAVVSGVVEFVDALPEGDHVSTILFDREASNSRILPRTVTPRTKEALRQELERLPVPSGRRTDLGRALDAVVGELGRPEGSLLQFVFLFSDFVHQPPDDSEFRTRDPQAASWQQLARRMRLVTQDRLVQSFGLMLPLSEEAGRDLPLVRHVLDRIESVSVDRDTLREWFVRRRAEIERDKLRALVDQELARGFSVDLASTSTGNVLTITSRLSRLRARVSVGNARAAGLVTALSQPTGFDLGPGESRAIDLTLSTEAPENWLTWLLTTRSTESRSVQLSIDGSIEVQPAGELRVIQRDPVLPLPRPLNASATVVRPGAPLWFQGAAGAAVFLFVLVIWSVWIAPAPPVHTAFRKVQLRGAGHYEELQIPSDGKRKVVLGNVPAASVTSRLGPPEFAIVVVSAKPAFPRLRPRKGLYAFREAGTVKYLVRQYDRQARRMAEREMPLPDDESRAIPIGSRTKMLVVRADERISINLCK